MYQLLLVDDELLVLEGLREYIDWNSLGFEIAGIVQNVSEALQLIKEQSIDALMTDIVMDKENGFDLVREAHKLNEQLKFVILSGYGNFNYALQAIQLGCVDFLIKPIDFEECCEVFTKLRHILDSENAEKEHRIDLYHLQQERFFRLFLEQNLSEKQISEGLPVFFSNTEPFFAIILFYCDEAEQELSIHDAELLFDKVLHKFFFKLSSNKICGVLSSIDVSDFIDHLERSLQKQRQKRQKNYISISSFNTDRMQIPLLFSQAKTAMKYRHIRPKDTILQYDKLEVLFHDSTFNNSDFERKLTQLMIEGEYDELNSFIFDCILNIVHTETTSRYASLTNIILSVNQFLILQNQSPFYSDYDAFKGLIISETTDDILDFFKNFVQGSIQKFRTCYSDSGNYIINSAKEYIQTHLGEDITLSSLAEIVYVNPCYLSKLFYKVTGQHFMNYLTSLRMEKAKKMLPDLSLKIYDIATLVGYDSSKHFSKIFQDTTGMTPTEFRNNIKKGSSL